jgi:hypothetical protein
LSPILGIWASSISSSVTDPGAYVPIATTTLATSTASVTFSSIPSTYTHLQIRSIQRSTTAGSGTEAVQLQFNSDTGTNYSIHTLRGDGGTAFATADASTNYVRYWGMCKAGDAANTFGAGVLDILDYADTNKYKTVRGLGGIDTNSTVDYIILSSGAWRSTSAISSIVLSSTSGNFAQYSSFTLYGIKG